MRTVGIAMVVVVAVGGGVALAGRGGSHGPAGGTGQVQTPSAQAVVASAAPTATLAPEEDTPGPLTPDSQVRPNAMGPVTVGMTVEDAEGAGGVTLVPYYDEYYPDCWFAVPEGWESADEGHPYPPVAFMVIGRTTTGDLVSQITRIDVYSGDTSTPEGIHIGSTERDVYAAYPDQVVASTDRTGSRLLIYVPPQIGGPDLDFSYSVIAFESDGSQVTGMRAGRIAEVITLDEGCA